MEIERSESRAGFLLEPAPSASIPRNRLPAYRVYLSILSWRMTSHIRFFVFIQNVANMSTRQKRREVKLDLRKTLLHLQHLKSCIIVEGVVVPPIGRNICWSSTQLLCSNLKYWTAYVPKLASAAAELISGSWRYVKLPQIQLTLTLHSVKPAVTIWIMLQNESYERFCPRLWAPEPYLEKCLTNFLSYVSFVHIVYAVSNVHRLKQPHLYSFIPSHCGSIRESRRNQIDQHYGRLLFLKANSMSITQMMLTFCTAWQ